MLTLTVPSKEFYDSETERFIYYKGGEITLEHSLVSISKWESKWKINFLGNKSITQEQFMDYIKCMTVSQKVDPTIYDSIKEDAACMQQIANYIEDPMTATKISKNTKEKKGPVSHSKIITSELVYAWMAILKIPFECQKWHLNRLLMLIEVTSIEKQPPKKMSRKDAMAQQRSLNAARKAKTGSKG